MKKKLRRGLYVLFGLFVYVCGYFWVHDSIYSIQGYLAVPEIQSDAEWAVMIENDSKELLKFHLPENEVANVFASQKDLRPEHGRSEVKVTYQKNFWGNIVAPRIHVIHPGWIRRP